MNRTPTNVGYCEMSAKLFVLANRRGYDSKGFIDILMSSELAKHIFNKIDNSMWLGETYVMSSLEVEADIPKGDMLPDDLMYWIGYLYRVWSLTYDDTPEEILAQASVTVLIQMYQGLHVMSYEMAIEDLKALYKDTTLYQSGKG